MSYVLSGPVCVLLEFGVVMTSGLFEKGRTSLASQI